MYPLIADPSLHFAVASVAVVSVVYAVRQHIINKGLRYALRSMSADCVRLADLQDAFKQRTLEAEKRSTYSEEILGRLRAMRVMPQVFVWDEDQEEDSYSERVGPAYRGVAIAFSVEEARRKVIIAWLKANPLTPSPEILDNPAHRRAAYAYHYALVSERFARNPEYTQLVSELSAYASYDEYARTIFTVLDLSLLERARQQALENKRSRFARPTSYWGPDAVNAYANAVREQHDNSPDVHSFGSSAADDNATFIHARVNEIDANRPINKKPNNT